MKLDYGHIEYDTAEAKEILSWKSLFDYDPTSIFLEVAVGDHYTIYRTEKDDYFLYCRHRIQHSFMGAVSDGQEYIQPISREMVCVYALLHNSPKLIEAEGLSQEQKNILEQFQSLASGEEPYD